MYLVAINKPSPLHFHNHLQRIAELEDLHWMIHCRNYMYMDFLASCRERAKTNLDSVVIYIRHFMGQGLGRVSIEFKPALPLNLLTVLNSYAPFQMQDH